MLRIPERLVERLADCLRRATAWEGGLGLLFVALTVLCLVPVWSHRLLPMLDTPNHLALVRGWHDYHNPTYRMASYYELRIRPVPYLLFYATIHLLMFLFPIEVANKLFLSAYLILFPLSLLALARALGRSPWLALGAFPLAFNRNWPYGFSSYLMGTALMFFALASLIGYLRTGRPRLLLALGATCTATYFSHVLPWFLFGACALGLLLLYRRETLRALTAAALMLPSVLVALYAYRGEGSEYSYVKSHEKFQGVFRDLVDAVMEFPKRVLELFPGRLDMIVFWILAVTLAVLYLWRNTGEEAPDREERALCRTLFILAVAYVGLPYTIKTPVYWWYVGPRVAALIAPLALLLPRGRFSGWQRLLFVPLLAGAVALPLQLTHLYGDFSRRNSGFMSICERLPRGSNTLVVVRNMIRPHGTPEDSGDPTTSAPAYWHFSSWPMALKGGYDPYLFDQGIPLRPRHLYPAPTRDQFDGFILSDSPDFDYYLVRDTHFALEEDPRLRVLERNGRWTLYERVREPGAVRGLK